MQLPEPWSRRTVLAIGGVTDVGFSDCGRYLLVISHSGRGLFDLASGNLVARDSAPVPESDRDDFAHTVAGFGPIEGEQVSVAGLCRAVGRVAPSGHFERVGACPAGIGRLRATRPWGASAPSHRRGDPSDRFPPRRLYPSCGMLTRHHDMAVGYARGLTSCCS
jgi:hypothetical protein